ncbi:nitrogen fixation protein FixC [Bradyrhizobium jicamae]|uniref:Protein FixC n=1 Tax=Bradyrhizobium jicamae TaxID=280332 RepID=A0A0R3LFA0_9BRAD|nr:FAD-dependent oxidoreductase [Bradyrhizobium jicamae]KRR06484.1 nitrogen fixation protein FixC [Bradyrhizobium jicamae]
MIEDRFDAIVVGAGMAGNAAALTMAKRGMKVLQLERGEYSGSKNIQSAILHADMLAELIPDFRKAAPLERHLVEQRFWILDDCSRIGLRYRFDDSNYGRSNRYTIVRAHFDKWFSSKVREAGATVLCQTTVTELAQNRRGRVIGVRTDRQDGIIHADVVVLAEGVNGLLGTRAGLRERPEPDQVALAVREMHCLPREAIEARFNLNGDKGVVIETAGNISRGMTVIGFIYPNKESISLGIGCLVSEFQRTGETPYELLDRFKRHPSVARLIDGSKVGEYSAHLIPKGGYNKMPRLHGKGWVVVGDAAQLSNTIDHEGANVAMTSGRIAAEAIFQVKSRGDLLRSDSLSLYKKMLDGSFKHSKKTDMRALLHTQPQNFLLTYPQLVSKAMQNLVRFNSTSEAEKSTSTQSWTGMFCDAFRLPRALR